MGYLAVSDAPGKMFTDLVQWLHPTPEGQAYPSLNNLGLNRFALRVRDLDATIAALKSKGVAFLTEAPQVFGPGIRCIVATDPGGVFVQLVEGL